MPREARRTPITEAGATGIQLPGTYRQALDCYETGSAFLLAHYLRNELKAPSAPISLNMIYECTSTHLLLCGNQFRVLDES